MAKPFRFLDLPAELRNYIYQLAYEDTVITIGMIIRRSRYATPGLLMANKQIYVEGLLTFYNAAIFYFDSYWNGVRWYSALPLKQRDAIREVRYHVDSRWDPSLLHAWETANARLVEAGTPMRKGVLRVGVKRAGQEISWSSKFDDLVEVDAVEAQSDGDYDSDSD